MRVVIDCKGRHAPLGKQKMADLPTDRVIIAKPTFSFVGIDCSGPFLMRKGRSLVKRYGVLFTCMSIRPLACIVDMYNEMKKTASLKRVTEKPRHPR